MKLYAERSTRTSFILHTEDGAQAVYHKSGCTGDKKRVYFTYDREPACLAILDRKEKQAILELLAKNIKGLSVTID